MSQDSGTIPILEVKHLKQYFPIKGGIFNRTLNYVKAVDDISFSVNSGETLSIVGESGCGKSTTGRAILRLNEPTSGEIVFQGKNIMNLRGTELRKARKEMQIVFQDPFASLDPRQTIGSMLGEALAAANVVPKSKRRERIIELLENVGLRAEQMERFPHQLSGGQRQRIGIARPLAMGPKLIICDEAVSALDVSVQAQILNLLKALQQQYNLTYIFISHNLGVVYHISDRVMVMYLGKIMEIAPKDSLFENPLHPYTQALLSAIPMPGQDKKEKRLLQGEIPSPINTPEGCRFHTRCSFAQERCRKEEPALREVFDHHLVSCHFVNDKRN